MTTTTTVWKAEFQVNPDEAVDQFQTGLAITDIGLGNFVAVYNELGKVIGQIFDAEGNRVGDTFQVNVADDVNNQLDAALASRPGGGFVAAYLSSHTSTTFGIYFDAYDASGTRTSGGAIQPFTTGVLSAPSIAMRTDGSFLVTFARENTADNNFDLVGRRVAADGTVGDEIMIFDEDTDDAGGTRAEAATLSNGNYVVAYQNFAGSGDHDIEFKIFGQTGSPFAGNGFQIALGGQDETDPQVAALAGGGFVVVWRDSNDGSGSGIRAAVFNNNAENINGGLTSSFLVNTNTTGNQTTPDVTALKDGGFVVTWDSDSQNATRGQRFNASGDKVGSEFAAGDATTEGNPVVAALADGRFVVGFEAGKGPIATLKFELDATVFDPRDTTISGDALANVITSRIEGATVNGLAGDDKLLGQAGADIFDGGAGNDRLKGGLGKDTLTGGANKDTFVFDFPVTSKSEAKLHKDKVLDFSHKDDTIELAADQFSLLKLGKLKNKGFGSGTDKASDDAHLVYWSEKNGKLNYDANGKKQGGAGDIEIAKFNKDADLAANDILVA